LPWDMTQLPDPDYPSTFLGFDRASFSSSGGIWSIVTASADPNIFILNHGVVDTQKVLKLGDKFPVAASKYRLVSFRMCSSVADNGQIYWYLDPEGVPGGPRIGLSDFFPIVIGCRVYVLDMTAFNDTSPYPWSGSIQGLRIDPGFLSGTSIQLDWVRLTTASYSNTSPINWSGISSGTTLSFFLNSTCSLTDAMKIGTLPRNGNSAGTFDWGATLQADGSLDTPYPLPESFQPGQYTVIMIVDSSMTPICAATPLEIRKAPILTIHRPSMRSGPDYASFVVQDQWGMSNPEDLVLSHGIVSSSFSGGIWTATTDSGGDPWVHLHVSLPIDTTKYRYATVRMWLEGEPPEPQQFLSVQRWIWWYAGVTLDAVTTEDMLIREGWQTYSLDLGDALIDPTSKPPADWVGDPSVFRLDIHEETKSMVFHLDYVTLTGEETVTQGQPFVIVYSTTPASGLSVTFYYDSDTDPASGRTLMEQYTPAPFRIFLPEVMQNSAGSLPPEIDGIVGSTWSWDTTGVPPGAYYVSADVFDGVNTTTWYSETSVIVQ